MASDDATIASEEPDAIRVAAPVLGYAAVDTGRRPRTRRWLDAILWLGAIATVAAPICIGVIDVETVLVTGPALATFGLATVFLAPRIGDVEALVVGAVQLLACIGAFTMIWWNEWGPEPSRWPLVYVSLACGLVVAAFGVRRLKGWSVQGWSTVR